MEKKKKIILIVVISLLVILVLGLGGYIIYDKVISNSETKNNLVNSEEYSFKEIELNKCFSVWPENDEHTINCEDTIEANNKPVTIKLTGKNLLNDEESSYISKIFVNKKEIFSVKDFLGISKLLIVDDMIVFYTSEGTYVNNKLLTYKLSSNELKNIANFDKEIPEMTVFEIAKVVKNNIYFYGFRIATSEPSFAINFGGSWGQVCDKEDTKKYNINADTIIKGLYVMEYIGKEKFSITKIDEESIVEYTNQSMDTFCEGYYPEE